MKAVSKHGGITALRKLRQEDIQVKANVFQPHYLKIKMEKEGEREEGGREGGKEK